MSKKRHEERQTFAEMVAEVPEPTAWAESFSTSIPHDWITVDGQRFHRRGEDAHEGKDLHKLLLRTDLPAFHEYLGKRKPIEDREAFWERAVSYMANSEYSAFVGYEYKNPDRGRCLVVYEFC